MDGNICRRKGSNHFGPVGCLKRQAPLEWSFFSWDGRHLIQSLVQIATRGNKTKKKKIEIRTKKQVSVQLEQTELKDSNRAENRVKEKEKKKFMLPENPKVGLATIVSDSSTHCLVKTKGLFF